MIENKKQELQILAMALIGGVQVVLHTLIQQ